MWIDDPNAPPLPLDPGREAIRGLRHIEHATKRSVERLRRTLIGIRDKKQVPPAEAATAKACDEDLKELGQLLEGARAALAEGRCFSAAVILLAVVHGAATHRARLQQAAKPRPRRRDGSAQPIGEIWEEVIRPAFRDNPSLSDEQFIALYRANDGRPRAEQPTEDSLTRILRRKQAAWSSKPAR